MPHLGSRFTTILSLALLLSGFPAIAHGQGGRISGVVRDARGTPVPSANITVTNRTTRALRRTTTGADGRYTVGDLTPGDYNVAVALIGYRRDIRTEIAVRGETTVDFQLEPLPLQAITVTATLREQELADVPFSVAAPSAEMMRSRGVEGIETLAANLAGLSVQNLGPGQSQVAVRGASAGQVARDQPGVKEQVGSYLDDVPISLSLFTPEIDLFDVSRVEVLRGPQGTLFGSGSLSGTVRYITGQPELGAARFFGEIGASTIGGGSAGGNVKLGFNTPLGDDAAARVVAYTNQIGGYMDAVQPGLTLREDVNDGHRSGIRAALLMAPSEKFSVTPRVAFQRVKMNGWNRIDGFNILANPYTTSRPAVTLGERQHFIQIEEPFTDDFFLGDINARLDLGGMTLTSISAFTHRDILVVRDAGALTSSITGGSIGLPENVYTLDAPLNDATKVNVATQELRLAGGAGRTHWLVGAFYTTARRGYGQNLLVSGFEAATNIPTQGLQAPRDVLFYSDLGYHLKQLALFGEGTYAVTPKLDLTAGLRWYDFDEDRRQVFDGIFANDNTGTSVVSVPGSTQANGFAPRFIASYRANDRTTFNAQISRGFRLGGINDPLNEPLCTPQDLVTFRGRDSWDDETAWNYEVGTKTDFLGGKASLNLSAFHMDISDLQLIVTAGSCSSRLVFNVPEAVSQGLEVELNARPSDQFDFSVSASLNNSELRSTLTTTDSAGQVSVVSGIEDGNRLPSVPRVQASAAATYRFPLRPGSMAYLTGSFQHVGSRFTQIDDHVPGIGTVNLNSFEPNTIGGPLTQSTYTFDPEMPSYSTLNLRLGLNRANWEAALYATNLTDERALLALDRERGLRARVGYLTNQPRTVGVSFRFEY